METIAAPVLGEGLKMQKMPGHWVLARLGKRVLRPGGMQLTRTMLAALRIQPADDVVEFAPGMGITAQLTLALKPASYTAVERDSAALAVSVNEYPPPHPITMRGSHPTCFNCRKNKATSFA